MTWLHFTSLLQIFCRMTSILPITTRWPNLFGILLFRPLRICPSFSASETSSTFCLSQFTSDFFCWCFLESILEKIWQKYKCELFRKPIFPKYYPKTAGYHQHILRQSFLLKMSLKKSESICWKKCFFFIKFWHFAILSDFCKKNLTIKVEKTFPKINFICYPFHTKLATFADFEKESGIFSEKKPTLFQKKIVRVWGILLY